jgi:hypothetical protein
MSYYIELMQSYLLYSIDKNQIKDDGAKAIGYALQKNRTLVTLHLSNKYLL